MPCGPGQIVLSRVLDVAKLSRVPRPWSIILRKIWIHTWWYVDDKSKHSNMRIWVFKFAFSVSTQDDCILLVASDSQIQHRCKSRGGNILGRSQKTGWSRNIKWTRVPITNSVSIIVSCLWLDYPGKKKKKTIIHNELFSFLLLLSFQWIVRESIGSRTTKSGINVHSGKFWVDHLPANLQWILHLEIGILSRKIGIHDRQQTQHEL